MVVLLHSSNFEFLYWLEKTLFFQDVQYGNYYYGTLTLSIPVKLKNSIFEIAIIPQTLNINNWRTTRVKSINLHIFRKLIKYSINMFLWRPCLLSPLSRYSCSNLGWYYDQPSGSERVEGLTYWLHGINVLVIRSFKLVKEKASGNIDVQWHQSKTFLKSFDKNPTLWK